MYEDVLKDGRFAFFQLLKRILGRGNGAFRLAVERLPKTSAALSPLLPRSALKAGGGPRSRGDEAEGNGPDLPRPQQRRLCGSQG